MDVMLERAAGYLRGTGLCELVTDRELRVASCPLAIRTEGALAWFRVTKARRLEQDWRIAQAEIAALPMDRAPFHRFFLALLVADANRPRLDWGHITQDLHVCRKLVVWVGGRPMEEWLGEMPFLPVPDGLTQLGPVSTPARVLYQAGFAPGLADGLLGPADAAQLARDFCTRRALLEAEGPEPQGLLLTGREPHRRIRRVELENFRPFGRSLTLPLDADLTVVYGPNGSGKSSLAQALQWGLIGEVSTLERRHDDTVFTGTAPPYVNLHHPDRPAVVRLTLQDEADGSERTLERRVTRAGVETVVWDGAAAPGAAETLAAVLDARMSAAPHVATLKAMARQSHFLDQETIRDFLSDSAADRYRALAHLVGTTDFERGAQKLDEVIRTLGSERAAAEQRADTLAGRVKTEQEVLEALRDDLSRAGRSGSEALDLTRTAAELHGTALALGLPIKNDPPTEHEELTAFAQALQSAIAAEYGRLLRRREQLSAVLSGERQARTAGDEAGQLEAELAAIVKECAEARAALLRRRAQAEETRCKLGNAEAAWVEAEQEARAARLRLEQVAALAEAGRELAEAERARSRANAALQTALGAWSTASARAGMAAARRAEAAAHQERLQRRRAALRELRANQQLWKEARAMAVRASEQRTRLTDELAQAEADRQAWLRQAGDAETAAQELEAALKELESRSHERSRLLAALSAYLTEAACPLCGHDWQTAEALHEQVQAALREAPTDWLATEAALTRESQRLAEATAALARVEARLAGLTKELDTCEIRSRQAQARLDRWLELARSVAGEAENLSIDQSAVLLARWEQELAAEDRAADLHAAEEALTAARQEVAVAAASADAAQQGLQAAEAARQECQERHRVADQAAPADVARPVPAVGQVEGARSAAAAAAVRLDDAAETLHSLRVRTGEAAAAEREAAQAYEAARSRRSLLEEQLRSTQSTVRAYGEQLAVLGHAPGEDGAATELEELGRRVGLLEQTAERARWLTEAARVGVLQDAVAAAEAKVSDLQARLDEARTEAEEWAEGLADAGRAAAALTLARGQEQSRRLACFEPAVNAIYRRINPHPYFPCIRLEPEMGSGRLTIHAATPENRLRLPVQQYFSMAQSNIVALSIFLGTALLQSWSGLRLICMDDPVQQMDELNTVAFLDTLQATIQHRRQVVITTADRELYHLMLRRFAYLNHGRARFRAFRLRLVNLTVGPEMVEDSPDSFSETIVRLGPA